MSDRAWGQVGRNKTKMVKRSVAFGWMRAVWSSRQKRNFGLFQMTLETCNCHVVTSSAQALGPGHGSALLKKLAEQQNFRRGCICRPQLNAEGGRWDSSVTSVGDCNSYRETSPVKFYM